MMKQSADCSQHRANKLALMYHQKGSWAYEQNVPDPNDVLQLYPKYADENAIRCCPHSRSTDASADNVAHKPSMLGAWERLTVVLLQFHLFRPSSER